MEQYIKETAYKFGANVCGIGTIDRFATVPDGFSPLDLYDKCKSVIAVGIALPKGIFEVASRLMYGHFNENTCTMVDTLTFNLAKELEQKYGCVAVPIPCDSPYEYWDADNMTGKGLMSMKDAAVLCGLGSIGKSTLLINETYGNRLTIGVVLTDMELTGDPIQEDLCIPGCRLCIESCPVQAIEDGKVIQKKCRLNTYGKTARGFDTVDCNKCRVVCPMRYGKKA